MLTHENPQANLSRRSFLLTSTRLLLGLGMISIPATRCPANVLGKRSLSFFHFHTQQELNITYSGGKTYDHIALTHINLFLRDYQTGDIHAIDPKLLDILWDLQQAIGRPGVYEVFSGYRSPKTNSELLNKSCAVARQSLHMKGQAIDFRFSEASIDQVYQCALTMQSGGIGYYPKAGFIHLDTGMYRTW